MTPFHRSSRQGGVKLPKAPARGCDACRNAFQQLILPGIFFEVD
jgi:hypothetical protein